MFTLVTLVCFTWIFSVTCQDKPVNQNEAIVNHLKSLFTYIPFNTEISIVVDHGNIKTHTTSDKSHAEQSILLFQIVHKIPVKLTQFTWLNPLSAHFENQQQYSLTRTFRFISLTRGILLTFDLRELRYVLNLFQLFKEFSPNKDLLVLAGYGDKFDLRLLDDFYNAGKYISRHVLHVNQTDVYSLCHYCGAYLHSTWERLYPCDSYPWGSTPKIINDYHEEELQITNVPEMYLGKMSKSLLKVSTIPKIHSLELFTTLELVKRLNVTVYFINTRKDVLNQAVVSFQIYQYLGVSGVKFDLGQAHEITFIKIMHPSRFDWSGMMGPLGKDVSFYTLISIIVEIMLIFILIKFGETNVKFGLTKAFELITRPVLGQFADDVPSRKIYIRLSYFLWVYYCLVITETYKGQLINYLVSPFYKQGPTTFIELVKSNSKYFAYAKSHETTNDTCNPIKSNTVTLFWYEYMNTNNEHFKQIHEKLNNCQASETTFVDVYKRAKESGERFVGNKIIARAISEVEKQIVASNTEVFISKDLFQRKLFWLVLETIFQPELLYLFGQLRDSGIFGVYIEKINSREVHRIANRIIVDGGLIVKQTSDWDEPEPLKMFHFLALFFFTLGFWNIAISSFILEGIVHKINQTRNKVTLIK